MLTPNGKGWKRPNTKQELAEASAKLRTLLDDAMLTQVEAADLLGIDHRTMRRYVLGQAGYSYCVWYAMRVLHEQKVAEKPQPNALRTLKREELDRELDKWRNELSQCAGASRAHARALDHLRAIHDEFVRRDEKRHDVTAAHSQKARIGEPESEEISARRRAGANKAWSDPVFRAGGSERALKAAATRRLRKQAQQVR